MQRARTQRHVQFSSPKAVANESKYPNIVELAVAADGLDVTLGRRIMIFINRDVFSRITDVRLLGKRKSFTGGAFPIWLRLAHSSISSVGSSTNARRIAATIAKLPEL